MKTYQVMAPAKVNLFLGVGQRRDDGFHSVDTVMHTLALHDRVTVAHLVSGDHVKLEERWSREQPVRQTEVQVRPGDGLTVFSHCVWADGIEPADMASEDNLTTRAVESLAERLGRHEDECFRITVEKHVPPCSGLGGGSSDAAAALVAACAAWDVPIDDPRVIEAAAALGADVPFFLKGGCALMSGKGDELVREVAPMRGSVAIVRPEPGVSTSKAYARFDESPVTPDAGVLDGLRSVAQAADVPLFNGLEPAAKSLVDEVAAVRAWLDAAPEAKQAMLCGSGSAAFAVCEGQAQATALVGRARLRGWWARSTMFSPVGAALLPDKAVRW